MLLPPVSSFAAEADFHKADEEAAPEKALVGGARAAPRIVGALRPAVVPEEKV